jgi:hypothetical protein
MSAFLRSLLRLSRASAARLLLGVFVLGAALHGLHHLQDPACADGRDGSGHACACATLHGSTLVAAEVAAPTPSVSAWLPPALAARTAPHVRVVVAAAPRAPPAS